MTRDNLCHAFMVIMLVGAIWLNVVEPMFGPNPAFVASRPSHVSLSRPTGFNRGYGE